MIGLDEFYITLRFFGMANDRPAEITEALCKGCGTCVAACPSGSAQQNHFKDEQIFAEISPSTDVKAI